MRGKRDEYGGDMQGNREGRRFGRGFMIVDLKVR